MTSPRSASDSISAQEFQTAYRNYVDRMRGQISPEMLRAFRFDRQIMDALVIRHVITEEAKRLGLECLSRRNRTEDSRESRFPRKRHVYRPGSLSGDPRPEQSHR